MSLCPAFHCSRCGYAHADECLPPAPQPQAIEWSGEDIQPTYSDRGHVVRRDFKNDEVTVSLFDPNAANAYRLQDRVVLESSINLDVAGTVLSVYVLRNEVLIHLDPGALMPQLGEVVEMGLEP